MLGKITALTLVALAVQGCASLEAEHGQTSNDYCLTGTAQGCSAQEGAPDCQPCPPLHVSAK